METRNSSEDWGVVTKQVHGIDQFPLPRILQGALLGRALQVLSAPLLVMFKENEAPGYGARHTHTRTHTHTLMDMRTD